MKGVRTFLTEEYPPDREVYMFHFFSFTKLYVCFCLINLEREKNEAGVEKNVYS